MSQRSRQLSAALTRLRRRLDEPLLIATGAAIVGILLADTGIYNPVGAVVAICLGVGFFLQSRQRTFLLLAVAGTFALAHDHRRQEMFALPFSGEILRGDKILVEAEGIIGSVPKAREAGRPARVSFFLALDQIRQLGSAPITTSQRVYVTATVDPPPRYGDRLHLSGYLRSPSPPRNPGEFDFGNFLRRKGVIAQLDAKRPSGVQILDGGHGSPIIAAADEARRWVARTITGDLAQRDPEVAGVLTAMTLGTRADARDELIDSFRTSGTLHIFAVSGLHVGLIGIILWLFLRPMPLSRRTCAIIIIVTLCCYAFVTGLRPSAVRATIMACLVLSGPLINREPRVINSLGAAGFLILAFDSNQLFLPGFQLSFAVLLALILLHRPILTLLMPLVSPDPFLPNSLLTGSQRVSYKAAGTLAETFAVSVAAWIGSLPLMIYHFHLVTPIAPIANLFLIPIAFCVLGTAILSILAGAAGLGTLCTIFNNTNLIWASALTATASAFANLPIPISHFYTSTPNAFRPPCEITVLDLQRGGASTLISTRAGTDWLIDTGNARDFRPTIASVLHEHAGITHLDALLLTHADAAHIGGAGEVIENFRPEEVFTPHPNRSSAAYRNLASKLQSRGERGTRALGLGQTLEIDHDSSIEILYAPAPDQKPRLSDDACIVLLLETQGWRILFTGDAGFSTEKQLLESVPHRLRADLIIRGHHGADHTLAPSFLDAVNPTAIISNTRDFENAGPDAGIWQQAAADRGITLLDQSETGAVTIRLKTDCLEITSFLSDQSLILSRTR